MPEREQGRLTLRAVEIFVSVVEERSLGGGARRLGASASTVSQQIANLEEALGVSLIDRGARPFALTPAGRLFHARALAILDEVSRARSELSELDLSAVRELTLALLEDLEGDVLPELLVRLARTFPNCNFVAHTGYSHRNLEALENRSADLIVSADGVNLPDWIERHEIVRDPLILICADGVLGQGDDMLEALVAAPMVRFGRSLHIGRQIEAHLRRVRLSPPHRFEVETNKAMVALVARSRGWAITTPLGLLSSGYDHAAIEAHPMPFPSQARVLSVCTRRDVLGTLPAAVSAVLRSVISENAIVQGQQRMPWLGDGFRVLGT